MYGMDGQDKGMGYVAVGTAKTMYGIDGQAPPTLDQQLGCKQGDGLSCCWDSKDNVWDGLSSPCNLGVVDCIDCCVDLQCWSCYQLIVGIIVEETGAANV
eukprot:TRINITY_DN3259_c0_g1_i10.p1 TRINITY_DN3259_c0_g1~~TRINITY_DN3259_c0_g1_i10.p1  ORF type:complete len:100 (-),score=4.39 TRINITY_DN3259_c0_g1_i10:175-474(-)